MSVIFGAADALFYPAATAIVPEILPAELLVQGSALSATSHTVAQMLIGPALGGLVVAALGYEWAFAIDAASFALSAGCVLAMANHPRPEFVRSLPSGRCARRPALRSITAVAVGYDRRCRGGQLYSDLTTRLARHPSCPQRPSSRAGRARAGLRRRGAGRRRGVAACRATGRASTSHHVDVGCLGCGGRGRSWTCSVSQHLDRRILRAGELRTAHVWQRSLEPPDAGACPPCVVGARVVGGLACLFGFEPNGDSCRWRRCWSHRNTRHHADRWMRRDAHLRRPVRPGRPRSRTATSGRGRVAEVENVRLGNR